MNGRTATGPSVCKAGSCTCCRELPPLQRRVEQLERELREEKARARRAELRSERLQADVHVLERELDKQLQQDLQRPLDGAHGGTAGGGPDVAAGVEAAPATPDIPMPQSPQHLQAGAVPARAAGTAAADGEHGAPEEQLHEPQLQHHHQQQAPPPAPPPPQQQQQQQQQRQSPTPPATRTDGSPANEARQHGDFGWRNLRGGPAGVGAGVAPQRPAPPAAGPAVAAGAAPSPLQRNAGHGSDKRAPAAAAGAAVAGAAAVPTAAPENRADAQPYPHNPAPTAAAAAAQDGPHNPLQADSLEPERSAGSSGQAYGVIGGSGGLDEEGSISFGFRGGGGQGGAAAGGQTDSASEAVGVHVKGEGNELDSGSEPSFADGFRRGGVGLAAHVETYGGPHAGGEGPSTSGAAAAPVARPGAALPQRQRQHFPQLQPSPAAAPLGSPQRLPPGNMAPGSGPSPASAGGDGHGPPLGLGHADSEPVTGPEDADVEAPAGGQGLVAEAGAGPSTGGTGTGASGPVPGVKRAADPDGQSSANKKKKTKVGQAGEAPAAAGPSGAAERARTPQAAAGRPAGQAMQQGGRRNGAAARVHLAAAASGQAAGAPPAGAAAPAAAGEAAAAAAAPAQAPGAPAAPVGGGVTEPLAGVIGRRAKEKAIARITGTRPRPPRSNTATAAAPGAGPSSSAAGPADWSGAHLRLATARVAAEEVVPVTSLDELQVRLKALAPSAQQQRQPEKEGGSGAAAAGLQQPQQKGGSGAAAAERPQSQERASNGAAASGGRGGGGGGGHGSAGQPVFDLGGRELGGGAGDVLVVPAGVKATIRNGGLHMSDMCVLAQGGSQLLFEEVTFRGRMGKRPAAAAGKQPNKRPFGNDAAPALVIAEEPDTLVALVNCDLDAQTVDAQHVSACAKEPGQSPGTSSYACVLARGGGRVEVWGGSLTGAASGLVVEAGSFAGAVGTKAEGCAGVGFRAVGNKAELQLYGCTACGNGGHGVACCRGAKAVLGADGKKPCVVDGNGRWGLRVWTQGSVLEAGAGTLVMGNSKDGAGAKKGGLIIVGDRVVLRNNAKDGLVAARGGKVRAKNGVGSYDNGKSGFSCCCANSVMQLGDGAIARGNGEAGFISDDFGHMAVGQDARAEGNYNGFQAEGDAHLELGPGSVARGNKETGYLGLDHGELVVEAGGRAEKNGPKEEDVDDGSAAGGSGVHGSGARGSGAGGSGAGGSGDVGRGEQGNGAQGAAAQEDKAEGRGEGVAADGGTVILKAGFISEGNRLDGLVAENGGRLDASEGGVVSRGNGRHGVRSKGVRSNGVRSMACLGAAGTVVEGNQGSGCMAKAGGVLRLGPGSGGVVRGNQERGLLAKGWVQNDGGSTEVGAADAQPVAGGQAAGAVVPQAAGAGAAPGAEVPAGRVEGGEEWEVSDNVTGDRQVVGSGVLAEREVWPFAAGEVEAPRGRKRGRKGGKYGGKRRA